MKQQTTIKSIRNNYSKIFRCGYCDLQYIMSYNEPQFYNAGVYGWNCDVYIDYATNDERMTTIAITTGYRNMAGERIPDELIKKYSNIAKEILNNPFSKPYAELKAELDNNKDNFINELNNL